MTATNPLGPRGPKNPKKTSVGNSYGLDGTRINTVLFILTVLYSTGSDSSVSDRIAEGIQRKEATGNFFLEKAAKGAIAREQVFYRFLLENSANRGYRLVFHWLEESPSFDNRMISSYIYPVITSQSTFFMSRHIHRLVANPDTFCLPRRDVE